MCVLRVCCVVLFLSGGSLARAGEETLFWSEKDARLVVFSDFQSTGGATATFGYKQAYSGTLNQSVPVSLITYSYALDRATTVLGRSHSNDPLLQAAHTAKIQYGFQYLFPNTVIMVVAGVELRGNAVSVREKRQATRGTTALFELWSHPTPRTMVSMTLAAGSIEPSLWARARWGVQASEKLPFLGVETAAYLAEDFRRAQIGLHVSNIPLHTPYGSLYITLSGGYQSDTEARGGYGTLTLFSKM
jgi:Cellulose biosynthesis protein BcsS